MISFAHQPDDLIDAALYQQLCDGQQEAWHGVITQHESRIYGYLYRLEGNTENALDLTQEVFYKAWRSIQTFKVGQRFLPWLYQIARNTQIESHRRKQLQRFSLNEAHEELGFEVASVQQSPLEQAEQKQTQDRVQAALMQLSVEYREALVLRFMEDFSYDEIAVHQGVALGTAKSRVYRAKEQLAELLGTDML